MQGGDDLEDDFVPDETVALSGDEGFGTTHLDEEDVFVDDGDDAEQDGEDEDEYDVKDALSTPAANGDPAIVAKKRKRREKEKEKKAKVCPSETSFANAEHDLCK
jgi:protein CMS1